MELEEREGWLFVRLRPGEKSTDLDWDCFIRWKIPESERVYVADSETWIVRCTHRPLIERVYEVYRRVGTAGMDTEALKGVQALIDKVEEEHPAGDATQQAPFKAWLKGIGLN
jgi:hypothetical protein